MTITEAIEQCEELSESLERNLPNYAEPVVDFRQIADWLRELKAYRDVMIYLFTAEPNKYPLYKWTNEYGYVIQVTDVISAFRDIKDIQNVNIKREGKTDERKTEGKEV